VKKADREARRQEAIIDPETLLGAIRDAKAQARRGGRQPLEALACEPVLREFLLGALLETAGLAALHGSPPVAVRGMNAETRFMLTVTFEAVRRAHRRLYEDLLPQAGPAVGPDPAGKPAEPAGGTTCEESASNRPASHTQDWPVPPAGDKEDLP